MTQQDRVGFPVWRVLALVGLILGGVVVASPARGAYPGPNGRIAFEINVQGVMNADGSGQTNLTPRPVTTNPKS